MGGTISFYVCAAAGRRAFSCSISTVCDRARRVSGAVHGLRGGYFCGARSFILRGRLFGCALRSGRERFCVAPKMGIARALAGVDFGGAGNSPPAARSSRRAIGNGLEFPDAPLQLLCDLTRILFGGEAHRLSDRHLHVPRARENAIFLPEVEKPG